MFHNVSVQTTVFKLHKLSQFVQIYILDVDRLMQNFSAVRLRMLPMDGMQGFHVDYYDFMTIKQLSMTSKHGIRKEFGYSGCIVHCHQNTTTVLDDSFIKQKMEDVRIVAGIQQAIIWYDSKYNDILEKVDLVDLILQCQRDNPSISNYNPRRDHCKLFKTINKCIITQPATIEIITTLETRIITIIIAIIITIYSYNNSHNEWFSFNSVSDINSSK